MRNQNNLSLVLFKNFKQLSQKIESDVHEYFWKVESCWNKTTQNGLLCIGVREPVSMKD